MKVEQVDSLPKQQVNSIQKDQTNKRSNNSSNNKPDSLQEERKYNQKELEEDVKESVSDLNEIVKKVKEDLAFKIHDKTDKLMVQIVDLKTQEVIKELPPEEMLDLEAKIHEMVGLLIDEKV